MKFVDAVVTGLIFVVFFNGIGLAETASQLSEPSEDISVDSSRAEQRGALNSPSTEKSEKAAGISERIFDHPEFYYVPFHDLQQVVKKCLDNWRTAESEFNLNRSWTYGFDEARKRGYRLGRERKYDQEECLRRYLDRPLMPHPEYKPYRRPFNYEYRLPGD